MVVSSRKTLVNKLHKEMHEECFRAINRLQKNDDVIITEPDKDFNVVLLNKSNYVDKINEILDNQSKFKRLGPVSSNDNTASIESRLQKRLLDLVKADLMLRWIYDAIRPTESQKLCQANYLPSS